ncbi:MAG: hypothetical protein QM756_15250 [Polyangiaceae bacterium]
MRILVVLALLGSACHGSKSRLECNLRYASTTQRVGVAPVAEPYDAPLIDVGGRFAFKAVLRETPAAARSISLYAYERGARGDVLLQQLKYAPPYPGTQPTAEFGFTGHQFVYSSDAREFEYWCTLSSP